MIFPNYQGPCVINGLKVGKERQINLLNCETRGKNRTQRTTINNEVREGGGGRLDQLSSIDLLKPLRVQETSRRELRKQTTSDK